jgi:copper chaperone CopZ
MFNIFKKSAQTNTPEATSITYKICGMHCNSCAMNIDGELEDIPGVKKASTHYAKSTTTIEYNPQLVTEKNLQQTIEKLGYTTQREV